MRLTDKDKFIKALDFLIYELHYPYDPPPFNDWTEEQKQTADWFIMHIRNMMEHAQETDAIPISWIENRIKQLSDIVDGFDKASVSYLLSDVQLDELKDMLKDWEKENA